MSVAVMPLWTAATTINGTAAVTSLPISQLKNKGFCSLLLILAGSTPSIDVTQTVGTSDTSIFYSPVDGSGTALTITDTSVTATSWIQFSPVVAPFIKIVLTGSATNGSNTTAQAWLIFAEEPW